jgi:hypothetical protein
MNPPVAQSFTVYGTRQEAEAYTRPVGLGLELICIVTGVPRSPACGGGL